VRSSGGAGRRQRKVRRSPHLVFYWRRGVLLLHNYATRRSAPATPLVCELLNCCHAWRRPAEIEQAIGVALVSGLAALIDRLVSLSFLEASDRTRDPREQAMSALTEWNPEAGFFHTATRDVPFSPPRRARRHAREKAASTRVPPPVKRYKHARRIDLPPANRVGEFAGVLRTRRTWRRYSTRGLRLDELSTLLALTAGVQHWVHLGSRRIPLKTSPSGGARHAIECYVVSRNVHGLASGIYHYAADRHSLERLGGAVPLARMQAYVPGSGYFAKAAVMIFFTAVFERIFWRYPYSRAYRAALVEAGHVCQTFCLTATWLGLAPYCVMGLADSLVERDLGLDGITEAVLYCAGAGRPPRGASSAPLTRGTLDIRPNPFLLQEP
jgi:SagB-type dehydrogenase family enzyme